MSEYFSCMAGISSYFPAWVAKVFQDKRSKASTRTKSGTEPEPDYSIVMAQLVLPRRSCHPMNHSEGSLQNSLKPQLSQNRITPLPSTLLSDSLTRAGYKRPELQLAAGPYNLLLDGMEEPSLRNSEISRFSDDEVMEPQQRWFTGNTLHRR
ncbi:uncharacterized protein CIMG_08395 [Coccidioides immitis RS]|uniref:Uncharacterized protein n=1 Tax=Coccidioides immitis (strain RS) TaxID=246410 RepID=J3K5F0_COCIM|nr:uncharacterized protein CIMG_08395 [Coccidioides immitis RS]EAS29649.3 hypothetical protein CIMG_08395 [Coccidioides immitis RS]